MTDMWSTEEMIQCATLGIPMGMKKWNFYFYCFLLWLFDQKWKYNFQGMRNKKLIEIILHVGLVTSLHIWLKRMSQSNPYKWMFHFWLPFQLWRLVTRSTCNIISNSFFCFAFLWSYIFISDQKVIEIEIAFFHSIGNLKGRTLDHFFYASHVHIHHNFSYKLIPISLS